MCAFDAAISAPDADIYDFALLQSDVIGFTDFLLSDAILAYDELRNLMQSIPGPLVINNSWGMYDRADDEPIGSSGNYSANPLHPFNLIVGDLVEAGADIFFAAGNCGGNCPDYRCGHGDVGPGSSIHGANSHPDVITIAAVTVNHVRLGYSSQGPGGLTKSKPDLAGYSHFKGSGVYEADSGTSAACPVAAGVAAAIRQGFGLSSLEPAQLKAVLQRTAKDVGKQGWDYDHGFGVINAAAAISHLTGS
ncbi:MAG: S8 family peptidase [Candidatus Competibacteraceae bacterium]|nr:S8 family peptidase [Candidatus Competibacteraceae bacterium]